MKPEDFEFLKAEEFDEAGGVQISQARGFDERQ